MATVTISRLLVGGFLSSILVTGCVSKSKHEALEARNTELEQEVAQKSGQVAAGEAKITRLQRAIKYTVDSDMLFATGSWEMRPEGKQILAKMANKLAPTQENKLVVNGYTDNVPIGPELEQKGVASNKTLSQKRAEAVKTFLISQGVDGDLVMAVGHGEANPVARNDTAKGRSKNRRVELTLGT